MEKRLEPMHPDGPMELYGGGQLPAVGQVRATLSRPGHEVTCSSGPGTPADLLIGTDLLAKLGFLFLRTEIEL